MQHFSDETTTPRPGPPEPLYDPPPQPLKDPPNEPLHDPEGDPTQEAAAAVRRSDALLAEAGDHDSVPALEC
jgi:hypothetical protein